MILVNGMENGQIDALDRGFSYGDGVFRTLKLRAGRPVLWSRHYAKLAADSAALRIDCPAAEVFEQDIEKISAAHPDGVLRFALTRGNAARGYLMPEQCAPTRVVGWSAAPKPPSAFVSAGVMVRWCDLRLAIQPALAGIKHLNRMENVLARSEWRDPDITEGLLRDTNGFVIGGTMTNLFLLHTDTLGTPALTGSGVAGVMRELLIERATQEAMRIQIRHFLPDDVRTADALFLVNSIIGVWQIMKLDDLRWGASAMTGQLRRWIDDAESR